MSRDLFNRGIDLNGDGDGDLTKSGVKNGIKLIYNLLRDPKGTIAQLYLLCCTVGTAFWAVLELMDYGFSLKFFHHIIGTIISFYFYRQVKKISFGYINFFVKYFIISIFINVIFNLLSHIF